MILMAENSAASDRRQTLLSLFAVPCGSDSAFPCFFNAAVCHFSSDLIPFSLCLSQVQLLESLNWAEEVERRKPGLKKKQAKTEGRKNKVHWRKRETKRRGQWGGKRFRSHGLWMNATDRWVTLTRRSQKPPLDNFLHRSLMGYFKPK